MTDHQTTHAPGCWSWGPRHYECAVGQIERDEALLRQALTALEGMEKWASSVHDGYPPSTASIAAAPYREAARAAIAALRERLEKGMEQKA